MTLAMRMEREQFRGAGHDERAPERRGYAKPRLIDTLAGTAESGWAQDGRHGRALERLPFTYAHANRSSPLFCRVFRVAGWFQPA